MKRFFVLVALLCLFLPSYALAEGKSVDPAKSWTEHWNLYFVLIAIVFFVVTIPLIYFSFKYRRKHPDDVGADIHGNTGLEVLWTVVPLILVTVMGVQTWAVYRDYRTVPDNAYEVNVEGFMWGWKVTYPEGIKSTNEIRVPVGQPVKVNLTSTDVLHAFFIPEYHIQEEAIPGRTTYLWFNPDKVGEYQAYCTEFCGNQHSTMLAKIIVMTRSDFDAWVDSQMQESTLPPVEQGKKLVEELGCRGCHSISGETLAGPSFKGIYGRQTALEGGSSVNADAEYLEHAITDPKKELVQGYGPIMQPYKLSDAETDAMVEYFKTLK